MLNQLCDVKPGTLSLPGRDALTAGLIDTASKI